MAKFRWWLASWLICWVHDLMRPELTDDQLLRFEQFARTFGERKMPNALPSSRCPQPGDPARHDARRDHRPA